MTTPHKSRADCKAELESPFETYASPTLKPGKSLLLMAAERRIHGGFCAEFAAQILERAAGDKGEKRQSEVKAEQVSAADAELANWIVKDMVRWYLEQCDDFDLSGHQNDPERIKRFRALGFMR